MKIVLNITSKKGAMGGATNKSLYDMSLQNAIACNKNSRKFYCTVWSLDLASSILVCIVFVDY